MKKVLREEAKRLSTYFLVVEICEIKKCKIIECSLVYFVSMKKR